MGALERLAEAQISSNLGDDYLRLADVDYIRASGWAAQSNPDGLMLYRLKYANDHSEYKLTLQRAYAMLVERCFKKRMRIKHETMMNIAEKTLRHFVAPICPACLGRGYKVIPGTPTLSDVECPHCSGSGHLSLHKAIGDEYQELAAWLNSRMDARLLDFVDSVTRRAAKD